MKRVLKISQTEENMFYNISKDLEKIDMKCKHCNDFSVSFKEYTITTDSVFYKYISVEKLESLDIKDFDIVQYSEM
jgi:hypothetical protein